MHKDYGAKEVLAVIKEKGIKFIDLRFMDFPGLQQHFTFPVEQITEEVFEEGLGFDGSSIRGWQAINEVIFPTVLLAGAMLAWLAARKRIAPV